MLFGPAVEVSVRVCEQHKQEGNYDYGFLWCLWVCLSCVPVPVCYLWFHFPPISTIPSSVERAMDYQRLEHYIFKCSSLFSPHFQLISSLIIGWLTEFLWQISINMNKYTEIKRSSYVSWHINLIVSFNFFHMHFFFSHLFYTGVWNSAAELVRNWLTFLTVLAEPILDFIAPYKKKKKKKSKLKALPWLSESH